MSMSIRVRMEQPATARAHFIRDIALIYFFLRLLAMFQALGTAPAID